jgi:hypothetical protein
MTDFVNLPLDKLKNRENIVSRVERLEGKTGARPSATAVSLGEIAGQTGTLAVDGSIVVVNRTDGLADVTINDNGIVIRNQEGAIFFDNTVSTTDVVSIFIDSGNYLSFQNTVNEKGFLFDAYDAGHAQYIHSLNYIGLSLASGAHLRSTGASVPLGASYFIDEVYALENGWFPTTDTITRTGTHTFTVPNDRTTQFRKGAKFAYTDALDNEYGVIASSVYTATDTATTVTLIDNTDYGMSTDAIADPALSYIENPAGFPDWFNFDAAPTGFSAVPASPVYRWTTKANTIFIGYSEASAGTSNATTFAATAPVAAAQNVTGVAGTLVDNGALRTVAGRVVMTSGSAAITFRTDMANGAWTNANGKRAVAEWFFEF